MSGLLFIFLFLFMALGLPIAFSIMASSAAFLYVTNLKPLVLVAQRLVVGMDSFPLLAIPLFILAGYLMEESGLSKRLVRWVEMVFGWVPGSMGVTTIIACTIFAALTGSGPATVAAIGSIMVPSMIKSGYRPASAAGLTAAAGALGPVIPPSIAMIVYGSTMGVSIPKMFVGGVMPGLFIAFMLLLLNVWQTKKWGLKGLAASYTVTERLVITRQALGALLLPVIILGGIYGGVMTPTEAATIAVLYSMALGFGYRELTLKKFYVALIRTGETSAVVVFIIASANLFGWLLSTTRLPVFIAEAVITVINSQALYLLLLCLLLFFVGALMDTLASIVVLAPVLVPIGISLGVDPLHMSILFCVNLIVGFITPPFGVNLFTAVSVTGLSYSEVVKGVIPYMLVMMLAVLLITFIPAIATWLPGLAFER